MAVLAARQAYAADAAPVQPAEVAAAAQKILADHCYKCHGSAKQEGELRLDVAAAAFKGGESGAVIKPSHADDSLLIEYVSGKGDTVMPPPTKGKRLTDPEVAALRTWIDGGATWPATPATAATDFRLSHWSFQPVHRSDPPKVENRAWVRNEIDAFILAKLERDKITPSPEADRRTLIRRLTFDLLGLPPTPQEVDDFLDDTRPDAYERLVDRLLASPHFGERWGRHWLDRARYADSSGCVIDLTRPFAWRWRDWVIEAINNDLPFDQFTVEQIAGDLLPQPTLDSRIAVGFHQNALNNHEAGIDLEAERVKTTLDRTTAIGTAWLGLTVGCAQCHSHKYDPISQADFYRLYAFFDNLDDHLIDAPLSDDADKLTTARRDLQSAREQFLAARNGVQAEWESIVAARPQVWKTAHDLELSSLRSQKFAMLHPLDDGSLFVDGRLSRYDAYNIAFKTPVKRLTAVRIESLNDPDRFEHGPGRGADQQAVVTGITIETGSSDKSLPTTKAEIAEVRSDYCQTGFSAAAAIKCEEIDGWSLDQVGVPHAAAFVLRRPIDIPDDGRIVVRLEQYTGRGHNLVRFRVSVTDANPQRLDGPIVPDEIGAIVDRQAAKRSVAEQAALKRYFLSLSGNQNADLATWNQAIEEYAKAGGTFAAQTVLDRTVPRETFVHLRGDFRRSGEKVEPAPLAAISKNSAAERRLTRLDLANWIVDPANPLTARVAANDIWQHLFGVGLVDTPGDFGMQGDPPSYPELLDWLAGEYVHCGWSRKAMIHKIVCSAAYRQSSRSRAELADRDPKNQLLARQNRFRLEAEPVRDTILACSGLLNQRIGGPGFCVNLSSDDLPADWEPQLPPQDAWDIYRRGLYVIAKRTDPDPLLTALDAPDGAASCPIRRRTDTPIQSLTLLNDPIFAAAARALAQSAERNAPLDESRRIMSMFVRSVSREPTATEKKTLLDLFRDATAEYQDQPQQAAALAQVDTESPNLAEAAAWVVVARTILNLDETVTRE